MKIGKNGISDGVDEKSDNVPDKKQEHQARTACQKTIKKTRICRIQAASWRIQDRRRVRRKEDRRFHGFLLLARMPRAFQDAKDQCRLLEKQD